MIILFDSYRGTGPIHVDHTVGLNEGVKARINFPLLNCDGTKTAFYELSDRQFELHNLTQAGAKRWPAWCGEHFTPVTEVELNQPTIIRTNVPHAIRCFSNEFPRISLSISFKEDVVKYLEQEDELLENS